MAKTVTASASKFPPHELQRDKSQHARDQRHRELATESKVKKSGVRCDQNDHYEDSDPHRRVEFVSLHCSGLTHGEHEVEAADTDRPAFDAVQSGFVKQRHDLSWIDVTMTVKVCEQA